MPEQAARHHSNNISARVTTTGIIGRSATAVESALLLAARLQPHFVAFVARPAQNEPQIFAATPTGCRYVLVYRKDVAGHIGNGAA